MIDRLIFITDALIVLVLGAIEMRADRICAALLADSESLRDAILGTVVLGAFAFTFLWMFGSLHWYWSVAAVVASGLISRWLVRRPTTEFWISVRPLAAFAMAASTVVLWVFGRSELASQQTSLLFASPTIHEPLTPIVLGLIAIVLGSMEARADMLRGRSMPFGPATQGNLDAVLGAVILLAAIVSAVWLWMAWSWSWTGATVVAMALAARLSITRRTLALWLSVRPLVTLVVAGSACVVWLAYPAPHRL